MNNLNILIYNKKKKQIKGIERKILNVKCVEETQVIKNGPSDTYVNPGRGFP